MTTDSSLIQYVKYCCDDDILPDIDKLKELLNDCFKENGHNQTVALIHASEKGNVDIVKLLVENDVDLESRNFLKETALISATSNGWIKIMKILIDAGADVNAVDKKNWTSLMCASFDGHDQLVEILLDAGADISTRNIDDKSALDLVKENLYLEQPNYKKERYQKIIDFLETYNLDKKILQTDFNGSFSI